MAASLLTREQPMIDSGYAWLVSEANQHGDSDRVCCGAELLDRFDELVAARIVSSFEHRGSHWSLRVTGEVVLDVLEQTGMLEESNQPVPARVLVLRAHEIARQIISRQS